MSITVFRNVDASLDEPVSRWPTEALQAALERGNLRHWRLLGEAVRKQPWGEVARRIEGVLTYSRPYGIAEAMERTIARARASVVKAEQDAVAEEVKRLIQASGLTRAEFASRVGTSTSRLSTYATGKVTPSATLLLRMLRLADGPDEVHKMVLARRELGRWARRAEAEATGELDPKHARRAI